MNKENILIPQPSSEYFTIQCTKCNDKIIIYSHTSKNIYCKTCNELLAQTSGGKAKIFGNIIANLD